MCVYCGIGRRSCVICIEIVRDSMSSHYADCPPSRVRIKPIFHLKTGLRWVEFASPDA